MVFSNNKKNIFNKENLKIIFVGKLSLDIGSDRIFCQTFSSFLSTLKNCDVKLEEEITEKANDIVIFKKVIPLKNLKSIFDKNPNFLIGIINPSDKKGKIKNKFSRFCNSWFY